MRIVITPITQNAAPLGAFVDYLQAVREDERIALASKLHDELGGLLVSAAMDLGWAESHAAGEEMLMHLRRIGASLGSAIDMKRYIIERLRPTLLDNFGLFQALRWYFKHACHEVEAECEDNYSPQEIVLAPPVLSHIFRATQTLLDCTFNEQGLSSVKMAARLEKDELSIRLEHEHVGHETVDVRTAFEHELESVAHRVAVCRGELSFESRERGVSFYLKVPVAAP